MCELLFLKETTEALFEKKEEEKRKGCSGNKDEADKEDLSIHPTGGWTSVQL